MLKEVTWKMWKISSKLQVSFGYTEMNKSEFLNEYKLGEVIKNRTRDLTREKN